MTVVPIVQVGIDLTVRRLFASRSGFYNTKGHAFCAFGDVLDDYSLHMDIEEGGDCAKKTDRKLFLIRDNNGAKVGCAVINWRTCKDAPRYEFAGYVA